MSNLVENPEEELCNLKLRNSNVSEINELHVHIKLERDIGQNFTLLSNNKNIIKLE